MSAVDAIFSAVHELAASVFGSTAVAEEWLRTPNVVLSGKSPAEVLATTEGHRAVVRELKRIQYTAAGEEPESLL